MLEININDKFKLKDSVSVRNILGETFFMLDSETGKQYNLNEMEYEIIEMISKGMTFSETVENITLNYDAPKEQITDDLKEYFVSLIEAGLIIA